MYITTEAMTTALLNLHAVIYYVCAGSMYTPLSMWELHKNYICVRDTTRVPLASKSHRYLLNIVYLLYIVTDNQPIYVQYSIHTYVFL